MHISRLDLSQSHEMLRKLVVLHPALVFDVMHETEAAFPPSDPKPANTNDAPEWCKCGRCRPMASLREQLCCGCLPDNCHSTLPVSNTETKLDVL